MENIFLERFQELLNEKFNGNKANLSKSTGIPAPTLSQYFPPRNSAPSAKQLVLLAKAFDCTIDYLLGADDFYNVMPVLPSLTEKESKLLRAFSTLSALEQDKLIADAEFYSMRHRSKLKQ